MNILHIDPLQMLHIVRMCIPMYVNELATGLERRNIAAVILNRLRLVISLES